jgi:hypothetical protein
MLRASLRPSSGGQTAFSLPMVFCPVVTVVMLASRLASCVHTVTTGQKTIGSENAAGPPDDGRKDARSMLRDN